MTILGISAFYHDSAASIVIDGEIIAAAQEERFTRVKHDESFPILATMYCLEEANLSLGDVDFIAFYDKPLLKFERLLETYYSFAPRGLRSFIAAMPVWLREKMFLKREIYKSLRQIGDFSRKNLKILFPEHHLSHAASAFYPSPFKRAAILTIDGVGEWATASISVGEENQITTLKELHFPHSLGLLYSAFTYFLGFKVNSGEYKLMGLAPYGRSDGDNVEKYKEVIYTELVDVKPDGSLRLNQKYFSYATGLRMIKHKSWQRLFGFGKREANEEITQDHCDLALAIQQVTENVVEKMALEAKSLTGCENLCLSGGVALNCVANGKLLMSSNFNDIYIQPASGDAGGAVGAALAVHHIYDDGKRLVFSDSDSMKGSYLGPSYAAKDVEALIQQYGAKAEKYDSDSIAQEVAKILADENVVGWMQGRMEFGPRALGNRSILGDPRSTSMQRTMNLKIKYRESFRPFAPSVLEEDSNQYFEGEANSPYMLLALPVKSDLHIALPEDYQGMSMVEKLNVSRSTIPAVTHVDFSARVQTVKKEMNPRYWELLNAFKNETGIGMLINTSFNVRGEPIVNTPEDAYKCFIRTEMDYLVIGEYVFNKQEQPKWDQKDHWKEDFVLD